MLNSNCRPPVGAVCNRTASAQLETVPTKQENSGSSWKLPRLGAVKNSAYRVWEI